ncbi:uncharacterized, partial [Tachysurus ichikawai]
DRDPTLSPVFSSSSALLYRLNAFNVNSTLHSELSQYEPKTFSMVPEDTRRKDQYSSPVKKHKVLLSFILLLYSSSVHPLTSLH